MCQVLRRTSDHLNGLWSYSIISDVGWLGRKHRDASSGECASKIDESGLVDPKMVYTDHHHHTGRIADAMRQVQAAANHSVRRSERNIRLGHRMRAVIGQHWLVLGIRHAQEQSGGTKVILRWSRNECDRSQRNYENATAHHDTRADWMRQAHPRSLILPA